MAAMLAHILGSGSPWPLWITAGLLFGGAVAAPAPFTFPPGY
jgi:hypothetical protein